MEKPIHEENEKKEDEVEDVSKFRDLNSESEFHELLEKLGYIDRQLENDIKAATEISNILDQKLTRKNIMVFLCQLEKIHLSWMAPQQTEE